MVIRAVRTLRAACGGGRPQGLPVRQEIPPSPILPALRRGRFLARDESKGRRDGRGQRALPRRGGSRGTQAGLLRRPRLIAEAEGCAVVPPAARIVGGAVEYLIVDVRVFETDAYELQKVLRRDPDRQPTQV